MGMRHKIARLFVIKTRTEAWLVTYAVALGAVERGRHYLETYPGIGGCCWRWRVPAWCSWSAPSCSNSVRPAPATVKAGVYAPPMQRRPALSRSRPRLRPSRSGSRSPLSLHREFTPDHTALTPPARVP